MSYQLILKNGQLLGPGQGIGARADIATCDGRVAATMDSIPEADGTQLLDVSREGRHVLPGLVDLPAVTSAAASA